MKNKNKHEKENANSDIAVMIPCHRLIGPQLVHDATHKNAVLGGVKIHSIASDQSRTIFDLGYNGSIEVCEYAEPMPKKYYAYIPASEKKKVQAFTRHAVIKGIPASKESTDHFNTCFAVMAFSILVANNHDLHVMGWLSSGSWESVRAWAGCLEETVIRRWPPYVLWVRMTESEENNGILYKTKGLASLKGFEISHLASKKSDTNLWWLRRLVVEAVEGHKVLWEDGCVLPRMGRRERYRLAYDTSGSVPVFNVVKQT